MRNFEYGMSAGGSAELGKGDRRERKTDSEGLQKRVLDVLPDEVRGSVEGMTDGDILAAIERATAEVTSDALMNSHLIGGDFLGPDGKPRDRKVLDLRSSEEESAPFLRHLCLKLAEPSVAFDREVEMHKAVQRVASAELRVPRIVQELRNEKGMVTGLVMERLPSSERDSSLQRLIADARKRGMPLAYTPDVAGAIQGAYNELHDAGFVHDDVNEGNLYLTDVEMTEVELPPSPGKKAKWVLRVITSAKPVLLDFEMARGAGEDEEGKASISKENDALEKLFLARELDVDSDATEEELAEAYIRLRP